MQGLTGLQFNSHIDFKNRKWYILTNEEEESDGCKIQTGLVKYTKPWIQHKRIDNGIFFTSLNDFAVRIGNDLVGSNSLMMYRRRVTIPNDAKVAVDVDNKCAKADKMILGDKELLWKDPTIFMPILLHKEAPHYLLETAIDKRLISDEDWVKLVHHRSVAIEYMPPHLQTYNLCKRLVQENPSIIQFIRENLLDETLIKIALSSNGFLLSSVPLDMHTQELCDLAVQSKPRALRYAYIDFRTKELCDKAVEADPTAARFSPFHIKRVQDDMQAARNSRNQKK